MAPVAGEGLPLLYLTIVLLALSWVSVIARIAVRGWRKTLGLDDWLMCAGLILYTVTGGLVIACCYHGSGQRSENLLPSDIMTGTKFFFVAQFFYISCTVAIKVSICVTLLRIAHGRRGIEWTIWAVVIISTIAGLVMIIGIANICHPITTLWGETTTGKCDSKLNSSLGFFFSAVSILTDWTLAVVPGLLLWNIQMKPRIKFSVILMLGLGAFASCATIVRLRFLTLYNNPQEFMYSTGAIGLWSLLEEGIGIIAGSMPALRPLLNLPIFGRTSYGSNSEHVYGHMKGRMSAHEQGLGYSRRKHTRGTELNVLQSQITAEVDGQQRDKSRRSRDCDADSQKHILKQTQVTVTAEPSHTSKDWTRQYANEWDSNNYR